MEFKDFSKKVKKGLEVIVREKLADGKVVLRRVRKNNNVKMSAVSIVKEGEKAMPTIYLKDYYKMFINGVPIEEICLEIYEVYEEGINHFKKYIDVEKLLDFDMVRNRIFYKIVNYEMNKEMLKEHPYFKFEDMAIVFYVMVESFRDGQATALITNVHLHKWDVTDEEIREIAFVNTWKKYPPVIRRMEDIVSELIIDDLLDDDLLEEDICYGDYTYDEIRERVKEELAYIKDEDMEMYVLTNKTRCNGATCITYPNVLKDFAEKINGDFFVIPSSIHEVLLVPKGDWEKETIDEMVEDVNEFELDPVEILSNHAYFYNRKTGKLEY